MRVHLVTDRFSIGGGIEHIYQIVSHLTTFHFTIFGKPGPAVERFKHLENVDIHDRGYDPNDILKSSPDIIHFHHLKPLTSFFLNPFRKRISKTPVIYTAHGLHIHKFEFYPGPVARLKYRLRFWLERYILPKAHRVIAVSREDKKFIEEKYRLGTVSYLTNGIDFEKIKVGEGESRTQLRKQLRQQLRERLEFPEDTFLFITVARFDFQKGYDILLQAIQKIGDHLAKQETPCRFILVGDGEEMESMKQLSRSLGVQRFVQFLGSRGDVYDILRAGDVFLLPSRWEGLPIVLLETGLLKVPVIASDTYGNREIIGKSNGLLFKNMDSNELAATIMHLLNGRYDLESYAENLYKEVNENYGLERMLDGLQEIYGNCNQNS